MKTCPTCHRTFEDDALSFCLMDGAPLVDSATAETIAIQSEPTVIRGAVPAPAAVKQRSVLPWIALGALGMLVLVGISAFLLSALMKKGEESTNRARERNAALAANSTRLTAQPTQPAAAPPNATPRSQDTPDTGRDPEESAGEPTPITWTTAATVFKREVGMTYTFECPPDGTASAVWGSDIYTADSSICTAAVHAGEITLADGGDVTIEYRPGRPTYGATTRNGITSNNFGEYSMSFVIR